MKYINMYVLMVYKLLERPRNALLYKRSSRKYKKIIDAYDKELLNQYRKIEEMLDEELN